MQDPAVLVVVEISAVHDAEQLRRYQSGAREQIGRHGGLVVARGGSAVEGTPPFGMLMVQRWPTEQAFRAWQDSAEYQPLKAMRHACADLRIGVVPVVAPP